MPFRKWLFCLLAAPLLAATAAADELDDMPSASFHSVCWSRDTLNVEPCWQAIVKVAGENPATVCLAGADPFTASRSIIVEIDDNTAGFHATHTARQAILESLLQFYPC